jgi:hypothetical protein
MAPSTASSTAPTQDGQVSVAKFCGRFLVHDDEVALPEILGLPPDRAVAKTIYFRIVSQTGSPKSGLSSLINIACRT